MPIMLSIAALLACCMLTAGGGLIYLSPQPTEMVLPTQAIGDEAMATAWAWFTETVYPSATPTETATPSPTATIDLLATAAVIFSQTPPATYTPTPTTTPTITPTRDLADEVRDWRMTATAIYNAVTQTQEAITATP
jgi:hypothetical protein